MIKSSNNGFQRAGAKVMKNETGKATARHRKVVSPANQKDFRKICR